MISKYANNVRLDTSEIPGIWEPNLSGATKFP